MITKTTHGFDGKCRPRGGERGFGQAFSLGIFPILPKASGKGTKRGAVVVRVCGPSDLPSMVEEKAKEIALQLDAGTYTGPKRVVVK